MQQSLNLQDLFLNTVKKEHVEVTAFLTNGFQLHGYVNSYDNFVVLFCCDGKQNLVYKHAISTIAPSKNLSINIEGLENNTNI